jgi:hypothetical protein
MQVFDPAQLGEHGAGGIDPEKARLLQEEREAREREAEQAQKEKLEKECSDRDKEGAAAVRAALAQKVQKASKELGRAVDTLVRREGEEGAAPPGEALAYTVYDQDVRSRQNQAVKKIDETAQLDETEKEALLANHQKGVSDLEAQMEAERKRQEKDLDGMLKARLERRRKRAERTKGSLKDEERAAASAIEAEVEADAKAQAVAVEAESEHQLKEAKRRQEGRERAEVLR